MCFKYFLLQSRGKVSFISLCLSLKIQMFKFFMQFIFHYFPLRLLNFVHCLRKVFPISQLGEEKNCKGSKYILLQGICTNGQKAHTKRRKGVYNGDIKGEKKSSQGRGRDYNMGEVMAVGKGLACSRTWKTSVAGTSWLGRLM